MKNKIISSIIALFLITVIECSYIKNKTPELNYYNYIAICRVCVDGYEYVTTALNNGDGTSLVQSFRKPNISGAGWFGLPKECNQGK